MQLFIKSTRNKIFTALTTMLILSIFIVIRTCDYPILLHSKLASKLFIPIYTEKLFYNLSLSYITSYIFYITQIYIPETIRAKKALDLLQNDLFDELQLIQEFLFLANHAISCSNESTVQYKEEITPLYYTEQNNSCYILRRFSNISTLKKVKDNITNTYNSIENNKLYCDLDSHIVQAHSSSPIKDINEIIDCIDHSIQNSEKHKLTSDNIINNVVQYNNRMQKVLLACPETIFRPCIDKEQILKYETAYQQASSFDENTIVVELSTS